MIAELAADVGALLAAADYPVPVVYGPERFEDAGIGYSRIVIERDRSTGDTIQGPVAAKRGYASRLIGVQATVYCRSGVAGARVQDHEFECDRYVDALVVALWRWASQYRANGGAAVVTFAEARLLDASEFGGLETWDGVAYRLKFRIPRAIRTLRYTSEDPQAGQPRPGRGPTTGTISDVTNTETVE